MASSKIRSLSNQNQIFGCCLAILLFCVFSPGANAQRGYKQLISELKNNFPDIENNEIYKDLDDTAYYNFNYEIKDADQLFYSLEKADGSRTALVGVATNKHSKESLLGEIKNTGGVALESVSNMVDEIDLYLIKQNGQPIGYLDVFTDEPYHIIEFHYLPIKEIYKGLDELVAIFEQGDGSNYKGELSTINSNVYESKHSISGAKSLIFVKENYNQFFYEFLQIDPNAWFAAFGDNLELLAAKGFSVVEKASDKQLTRDAFLRAFTIEKNGKKYLVEVLSSSSFSFTKLKNTPSKPKERLVENKIVTNHIIDALTLWDQSAGLIEDFKDILSQSVDMGNDGKIESAQSKMKSSKWKLSNFRETGLYLTSEALDDAIAEAKMLNCEETVTQLTSVRKTLGKNFKLAGALDSAIDDFIYRRDHLKVEYANTMIGKLNELIGQLQETEDALFLLQENFEPCFVPESAVKQSTANTTYYELEETYDAPETFIPHSGDYNGEGLVDLLGRHIEDPAIQGFFTKTNSKETYDGGDGFYMYEGEDIEANFFHKRLTKLNIGKSYTWPYSIPKDNIGNVSASSLSFGETGSPYLLASNRKIDYMLFFDENNKSITSFSISTNAKNVREDWSKNIAKATKKPEPKPKEEEAYRAPQEWTDYGIKAQCSYDFNFFEIQGLNSTTNLKPNYYYKLISINGETIKGYTPTKVRQMLENSNYPLKVELRKYDDTEAYQIHKNEDGSFKFLKDFSAEDSKPVGIGATLSTNKETGEYKISFLSSSSAAYLGGIRRNDVLKTIDGQPLVGKTMEEVKELLTGNRGSSTEIVVVRNGEELEFTIKRK